MPPTNYWVITSSCPAIGTNVMATCSSDSKQVTMIVAVSGSDVELSKNDAAISTLCDDTQPIMSTGVCSSWAGSEKYCLYPDATAIPKEFTSPYCEVKEVILESDPSAIWVVGFLTLLFIISAACFLLYKIHKRSQPDEKSSFSEDANKKSTNTIEAISSTYVLPENLREMKPVSVKVVRQNENHVSSPMSPSTIKNRQVSWSSAGVNEPNPRPALGVLSESMQNAPRQVSALRKKQTAEKQQSPRPTVEPTTVVPYKQTWKDTHEAETSVGLPPFMVKNKNAAELYIESCSFGNVKKASVTSKQSAITFATADAAGEAEREIREIELNRIAKRAQQKIQKYLPPSEEEIEDSPDQLTEEDCDETTPLKINKQQQQVRVSTSPVPIPNLDNDLCNDIIREKSERSSISQGAANNLIDSLFISHSQLPKLNSDSGSRIQTPTGNENLSQPAFGRPVSTVSNTSGQQAAQMMSHPIPVEQSVRLSQGNRSEVHSRRSTPPSLAASSRRSESPAQQISTPTASSHKIMHSEQRLSNAMRLQSQAGQSPSPVLQSSYSEQRITSGVTHVESIRSQQPTGSISRRSERLQSQQSTGQLINSNTSTPIGSWNQPGASHLPLTSAVPSYPTPVNSPQHVEMSSVPSTTSVEKSATPEGSMSPQVVSEVCGLTEHEDVVHMETPASYYPQKRSSSKKKSALIIAEEIVSSVSPGSTPLAMQSIASTSPLNSEFVSIRSSSIASVRTSVTVGSSASSETSLTPAQRLAKSLNPKIVSSGPAVTQNPPIPSSSTTQNTKRSLNPISSTIRGIKNTIRALPSIGLMGTSKHYPDRNTALSPVKEPSRGGGGGGDFPSRMSGVLNTTGTAPSSAMGGLLDR